MGAPNQGPGDPRTVTPPRGTLPQRSAVRNDRRPELGMSRYQRWSPCAGQVAQIVRLMEQGLKEGGLGVALLQGYAPGSSYKEMLAIHSLVAKRRATERAIGMSGVAKRGWTTRLQAIGECPQPQSTQRVRSAQ